MGTEFDPLCTCGQQFVRQILEDTSADLTETELNQVSKIISYDMALKIGKHGGIYAKHMNIFIDADLFKDNECWDHEEGLIVCNKMLQLMNKREHGSGNRVPGCETEQSDHMNRAHYHHKCFTNVIYIDIVDFKPVNTYFSEKMGDYILALLANYLRECDLLENARRYMLVRKGGDEFNIFEMTKNCFSLNNDSAIENNNLTKMSNHIEKELSHTLEVNIVSKAVELFYKDNERYAARFFEDSFSCSPDFDYRLLVKGFKFRYGIGSSAKDACDAANRKKANENENKRPDDKVKENKREFHDEMKIFVGNDDRDANDTDKWLCVNKHLILVCLHGEASKLMDFLQNVQISNYDFYHLDGENKSNRCEYVIIKTDSPMDTLKQVEMDIGERKEFHMVRTIWNEQIEVRMKNHSAPQGIESGDGRTEAAAALENKVGAAEIDKQLYLIKE